MLGVSEAESDNEVDPVSESLGVRDSLVDIDRLALMESEPDSVRLDVMDSVEVADFEDVDVSLSEVETESDFELERVSEVERVGT